MRRETLLDFFNDFAQAPGEFLIYDDGYRSWRHSYAEIAGASRAFAARLRQLGIGKGEKVLLWGENRPGWIAALWGCLLEGVVAVPIDFRASPALLVRVLGIVQGRALVAGDEVVPPPLDVPLLLMRELERETKASAGDGPAVARDDVAEILFTSGATAEPKGVLITHRNVLANIIPVEGEVIKYRKYAGPFLPLRFLNLLPLSHLFGQAMATFIPPMLGGVVVFQRSQSPPEIVQQIQRRRISVLVCVPKILEVLRDYVLRVAPETAAELPGRSHWLFRWWRYRRVHRMFGWKFWSFVVGAAPLEPALEAFWSRLGFLVIQGYGLTETAPIVTLNHPFHARQGTVGKPIAGVEVKVAEDGEILVRGENVTRGYVTASGTKDEEAAFSDGWFHTGDIGSVDAEGRLSIRGRKKEMIVTADGLNVFPEDVERVLNAIPGVVDSGVVASGEGGVERVHAVLLLEAGASADAIVRAANARLEEHQKVHGASIWPDEALPRTAGTRKLKRRELRDWVSSGGTARTQPAVAGETLEALISRYAGQRAVSGDTTLMELGLSSLERVQILMAMEDRLAVSLDESAFLKARTIGDLSVLAGDQSKQPAALIEFPAWSRSAPARWLRRVALPGFLLPLARMFAWLRVEGREHLDSLRGPLIFAANHQSHMDTPAILAALPSRYRYRVAPAMSKEFFRAHFFPQEHSRGAWLANSLEYWLAALVFNAFPFPQREQGLKQALRYAGEMAGDGWSILIFPEGRRTRAGEMSPFQPGVAMLAARLGLPVVPVRIEGLERVLHLTWRFPRPGRVSIRFGPVLHLEGEDYQALAAVVAEAVQKL